MMLIQCMWVASCHYEAEFEADDLFHLAAKGFHVLLLVAIGASSDNFSIAGSFLVRSPTDRPDMEARSESINSVQPT